MVMMFSGDFSELAELTYYRTGTVLSIILIFSPPFSLPLLPHTHTIVPLVCRGPSHLVIPGGVESVVLDGAGVGAGRRPGDQET